MNLFDLIATEGRKFLQDAMPGGALNPEISRQGLMDAVALGTAPVPVVGDVAGLAADVNRMVQNPQERTLGNAALAGLGLLPFVPSLGTVRGVSNLRVRPSTDDVNEVMESTFKYGARSGNRTMPIDQLTGGVRMSDPKEAARVKRLAEQMSGPDGYISRLVVDDAGNVLEGQHRLAALQMLGETNVPVSVVSDLGRKYNTAAMEQAVAKAMRPDQANQLVRYAIEALEDSGSVEKALREYSMPPQFQKQFEAVLRASQAK